MKKVTFSDTGEVREYIPEDTPADPLPPDPAEQTLVGKRGRPPKPVEPLSPLQLSEKRMKTAEETYHGEKDALFAKVIELKDKHAWLDHPSVVARLDERLDKRCRKVVELGLQYEDRKQEWESERETETLRAVEDKLRIVREWQACIELSEAREAQHEALAAQTREHVSLLERLCENHDCMESIRAEIAAHEAKIAADEDRKRVLWLRGIL